MREQRSASLPRRVARLVFFFFIKPQRNCRLLVVFAALIVERAVRRDRLDGNGERALDVNGKRPPRAILLRHGAADEDFGQRERLRSAAILKNGYRKSLKRRLQPADKLLDVGHE